MNEIHDERFGWSQHPWRPRWGPFFFVFWYSGSGLADRFVPGPPLWHTHMFYFLVFFFGASTLRGRFSYKSSGVSLLLEIGYDSLSFSGLSRSWSSAKMAKSPQMFCDLRENFHRYKSISLIHLFLVWFRPRFQSTKRPRSRRRQPDFGIPQDLGFFIP